MRCFRRFHQELCVLSVFLILFNGLAPTVANAKRQIATSGRSSAFNESNRDSPSTIARSG